jgi:isoleucyl-tRNA synthetase
LKAEGLARDVVRGIQQARREAGFDVPDRIAVSVTGGDAVLEAVRSHEDFVKRETSADTLALSTEMFRAFVVWVGDGQEARVEVVQV